MKAATKASLICEVFSEAGHSKAATRRCEKICDKTRLKVKGVKFEK